MFLRQERGAQRRSDRCSLFPSGFEALLDDQFARHLLHGGLRVRGRGQLVSKEPEFGAQTSALWDRYHRAPSRPLSIHAKSEQGAIKNGSTVEGPR